MTKNQKYITVAFLAGLLVGFLVTWGVMKAPHTDEADTLGDDMDTMIETDIATDDTVEQEHLSPTLIAEGNVVHVKDQQAGKEVFLSRVELVQDGWIAVRETTDGRAGNILGAKRLDAGVYQPTVPLLRPTEENNTYVVVLYADDGDKEFDYTKDSLLTDRSGNTISMMFEAY